MLGALTQPGAHPACLEQLQHSLERGVRLGVEPLEHLMHDDPEALVKRLSGGDAQHARVLVAKRAGAVCLDVGGRKRQARPAAR